MGKEQIEAWEADLKTRIDPNLNDFPTTAFSIKPCPPSAIRQLRPECFLGKRRPEEGGYLLIDNEGRINVHFMIGTHRALQKLRERRQKGDKTGDLLAKSDAKYLRWLIVKALQLRVINKRELKAGTVNQNRMKQAARSLR